MPVFKLPAAKTMHFEWSYFAQKCIIFTCSNQNFKSFSGSETPGPLLTEVGRGMEGKGKGKGIQGFLPLK